MCENSNTCTCRKTCVEPVKKCCKPVCDKAKKCCANGNNNGTCCNNCRPNLACCLDDTSKNKYYYKWGLDLVNNCAKYRCRKRNSRNVCDGKGKSWNEGGKGDDKDNDKNCSI